jgi:poly(3-hydroxyalkanoate) synthetase
MNKIKYVCFVYSEKDKKINPWHSNRLFEECTSKKNIFVIKNAGHSCRLKNNQLKIASLYLKAIKNITQKNS